MSVASINNGTLQLSDLIISNEKYSNSAGYTPSTSTFSASLTGTSIYVPTIAGNEITLSSLTPPDVGYTINSYSNLVSLTADSATITPALQLTNSVDAIQLSVPSNGVLEVSGSISATSYTGNTLEVSGSISATSYNGGIGSVRVNVNVPQLTTDAYATLPNQVIPNFVGSASSAYFITPYGNGFNPYTFNIQFVSTSGGDTTISISATNLSGGTIPQLPISMSIMGIN
jgi:hypothetical protein